MNSYWWVLIPLAGITGYLIKHHKIHKFQNEGELLVRESLIKYLEPKTWHLLNNVTIPTADGTTQVDHILLSKYGVFVIETKHYKGWIFGDDKSKEWTQVIWGKKYRFQNPIHQNYKHLKAVQELLDFLPENVIKGIVVFTGDATFKTEQPNGVFSLSRFIHYLSKFDQASITENRLQFCIGRLEFHRLALTKETDVQHQENIEARRYE
jgi:hypothetical protein